MAAPDARPSRLRGGLLLAIVALYVASVPWYRAADPAPALWGGLPSWVAVAVVCYLAAACLNAWAWWITPVSDALPPAASGTSGTSGTAGGGSPVAGADGDAPARGTGAP